MSSVTEGLWRSWPPQNSAPPADEFFASAAQAPTGLSRRHFLALGAASLASASLAGCTKAPLEKIIPYVENPEGYIAGHSIFYASSWRMGGEARGLLVETRDGRPTRLDGHPLHPANLGKSNRIEQALLLGLYDETRVAQISKSGVKKTEAEFLLHLAERRLLWDQNQGEGLRLLTECISSPSLNFQIAQLIQKWPKARVYSFEPIDNSRSISTASKIFKKNVRPRFHFDRARAVICLDADFFGSPLYPVSYAGDFFCARRDRLAEDHGPQLFVAEASPTLTGSWTRKIRTLKSSQILFLAEEILQSCGSKTAAPSSDKWIHEIQQFCLKTAGHCLFIAGPQQPERVHEICHELNLHFGRDVVDYLPTELVPAGLNDLKNLAQDISRSEVTDLFFIGGNPVYQTPGNLAIEKLVKQVPHTYRFSLMPDETSVNCEWQYPLAHEFESWSDGVAFDGTVSVQQPLIAPLFLGKNEHEIVSMILGENKKSYELVQNFWRSKWGTQFENRWSEFVRQGFFTSAVKPAVPPVLPLKVAKTNSPPSPDSAKLEIQFRPDPNIWDGRFSTNPWLQELPKPITLLSWGNAALISPVLARQKKIKAGQVVEISTDHGKLRAPAWILPGQEDGTVTLSFGFGRQRTTKFAEDLGYDAFSLWHSERPDFDQATIEVTDQHEEMACTQDHASMVPGAGEEFIRQTRNSSGKVSASLYPESPIPKSAEEAWAMVIDLDSCIGCSACTVACQSENNIPVVGKLGVLKGREMYWIRVDRYFSGSESNPQALFQPVPCMHCEKAPCEEVCPVAATVHSSEGLNQMIYNRCIGTRYCANNCPYKVRRFNFFSFTSGGGDLQKMRQNPEVSVRPRGVMEKCSYCVQRINRGRVQARAEVRPIRDGEIRTACQVSCPTDAITFGNQNDPCSEVRQKQKDPRNYALLAHLGTKPRTTYLAKISEGHS